MCRFFNLGVIIHSFYLREGAWGSVAGTDIQAVSCRVRQVVNDTGSHHLWRRPVKLLCYTVHQLLCVTGKLRETQNTHFLMLFGVWQAWSSFIFIVRITTFAKVSSMCFGTTQGWVNGDRIVLLSDHTVTLEEIRLLAEVLETLLLCVKWFGSSVYHIDKGRDEDEDDGENSHQCAVGARLNNLLGHSLHGSGEELRDREIKANCTHL